MGDDDDFGFGTDEDNEVAQLLENAEGKSDTSAKYTNESHKQVTQPQNKEDKAEKEKVEKDKEKGKEENGEEENGEEEQDEEDDLDSMPDLSEDNCEDTEEQEVEQE